MYYAIGVSAPSVYRESTDSLIRRSECQQDRDSCHMQHHGCGRYMYLVYHECRLDILTSGA